MERAPAFSPENALDSDFVFLKPNDMPHPGHTSIKPENTLDTDFVFLDSKSAHPNQLKPREKVFYARLGAVALAAAMLAAPIAAKTHAVKKALVATEVEATDFEEPVITFEPVIEVVDASPAMIQTEEAPTKPEVSIGPLDADLSSRLDSILAMELVFAKEEPAPETVIEESTKEVPIKVPAITEESPAIAEAPATIETAKAWDGPVLNAYDGHIGGPTGDETYYNLPMDEIVDRMHRMGVEGEYWVREDGVKMLGNYVMVAANLKNHPRGSIVETSLGPGIVCDTGSFAKDHPKRLDIATNW